MKIFIVEDSAIVVDRLKILIAEIEGLDYVGSAANARDAVESILSLTPDIVILDIRLSGENGISVLERMKKEQLTPITIRILKSSPFCKGGSRGIFHEPIGGVFQPRTRILSFRT